MQPYKVIAQITTKWTIEVHANDKTEAQTTVEDLGQNAIEIGGDFEGLVSVEVTGVELLEVESEEDREFIDMDDLAGGEPAVYTEEEASEAYAKEETEGESDDQTTQS